MSYILAVFRTTTVTRSVVRWVYESIIYCIVVVKVVLDNSKQNDLRVAATYRDKLSFADAERRKAIAVVCIVIMVDILTHITHRLTTSQR